MVCSGDRAGGVYQLHSERKRDWSIQPEHDNLVLDVILCCHTGRLDEAYSADLAAGFFDPSPRPESVFKELSAKIHPWGPLKERVAGTSAYPSCRPPSRTGGGCQSSPRPSALLRMVETVTGDVPEPLRSKVCDPMDSDRLGRQSNRLRAVDHGKFDEFNPFSERPLERIVHQSPRAAPIPSPFPPLSAA